MKKILIILLTTGLLQAHMIVDAFIDKQYVTPDTMVHMLLSSNPAVPTSTYGYGTPSIDSLAPNNYKLTVYRNSINRNILVKKAPLPGNTTYLGTTFMGWFRIGDYSYVQMGNTNILGFTVAKSYLGGDVKDSNQSWLVLNKTRTQLTMVCATYKYIGRACIWTHDTCKSPVFAPLDTNKYHLLGYMHPWTADTTKTIKFIVNGVICGEGKAPRLALYVPEMCVVGGIAGTALQGTYSQNPESGFATGGAIIYRREFTAAQIKAVYDTNQTHNLRHNRAPSAVELTPTKTALRISCASLNPLQVHIPGTILQVITVNGVVLHTLQSSTGSITLPKLSTGRYFLKANSSIKTIFILR